MGRSCRLVRREAVSGKEVVYERIMAAWVERGREGSSDEV
jgi:hypothetical protein